MDDDQQFCLRWNNHQSTLVSVFDTLLENGTLVDCTLAAEGKYLKAHKVVLSACSPYFESLLSQQYDKHPIFILKDVKFQELKAMMDYMYRGEVNISQDQLAALLKAAESLQIKGLSDSRGKNENSESRETRERKPAPPPPAKSPPPAPTIPRVQGLTIEQKKQPKIALLDTVEDSRSREGSSSPVPRKRKKPRRRSQEGMDNHDASNSSESHSNQTANIPTTSKTEVPEPETKSEIIRQKTSSESTDPPQVPNRDKLETHSELMLEPKAEYIDDDMNEDSVEDLTLDDDDINNMEGMDHSKPGTSHGTVDGSGQGFAAWHMAGNQSQDEVFLAAQEAVAAHRDSQEYLDHIITSNQTLRALLTVPSGQENTPIMDTARSLFGISLMNEQPLSQPGYSSDAQFACSKCGKRYRWKSTMRRHEQVECGGKEPSYQCPHCPYRAKQKGNLGVHVRKHHLRDNKVKAEH